MPRARLRGRRREHVAPVKRGRRGRRHAEATPRASRAASSAGLSTPLSGPDEESVLRSHRERRARRADAGIDDDEMHGPDRKAAPVARDREPRRTRRPAAGSSCERSTIVGVRRRRQQHALHLADVAVGRAEVGEQRDDAAHGLHGFALPAPPARQSARPSRSRAPHRRQRDRPTRCPRLPQRVAAHAASGMRNAVSAVDVSIGGTVSPRPAERALEHDLGADRELRRARRCAGSAQPRRSRPGRVVKSAAKRSGRCELE